jgi:hypothetical protein
MYLNNLPKFYCMKNVIDLRKNVENGSPNSTTTLHKEQRGGSANY